jgi:HAD superfamily hydrolase (TIGR01509 family)
MGPLQWIRHVCFDKDGTLTDVHPYWDHICRLRGDALRKKYGLGAGSQDVLLACMGIDPAIGRIKPGGPVGYQPRQTIVESLARCLEGLGAAASAEEIHGVFREIDQRQQERSDYRLELLPEVEKTLDALRAEGLVLSLYSSDRKENCARILERLGLGARFGAVVGGGCVGKPKPDPEGFLAACRSMGVDPAESAYVGDTAEDMRMGLAGGAGASIGVATGLGTMEELRSLTPHVYRSLGGLLG